MPFDHFDQESNPTPVESLKKSRGGQIGAITGFESKLRDYLDIVEPEDLIGRVHTLESFKSGFRETNNSLIPFTPSDKLAEFFYENSESENRLNVIIQKLRAKIESLAAPSQSLPSTSSAITSAQVGHVQATPTSNLKLQKLKTEKFNGDFLKYQEWWDRFRVRYHENPAIPNKIDKFEYLLDSLEGAAAACLASLPPTEATYDEAIKILTRRFGRKVPRINAHVMEILKLSKGEVGDSPKVLRKTCDSMTAHVRSLRAMGALKPDDEEVSAILGPILFSRLPEDLCNKWYESHAKDDGIKVNELLEFLECQIEGRELSALTRIGYEKHEGSSHKKHDRQRSLDAFESPSSSVVFHGSTSHCQTSSQSSSRRPVNSHRPGGTATPQRPSCPFCQKDHFPGKCEVGLKKTSKECYDLILKSGRCFRCLGHGHRSNSCPYDPSCKKCKGAHHTLLCSKRDRDGSPSSSTSTSHTSSVPSKCKPAKVMLQTALVDAVSSSRTMKVRVLLDTASEHSFVQHDVASTLKFPLVRRENISVETFGGGSTGRRPTDVFRVTLRSIFDPSLTVEFDAYGTQTISNKFQPSVQEYELHQYDHLDGLEFCDMKHRGVGNVKILIGADCYHEIVDGEVRRGKPGEPVAVSSVFGWLLSGPIVISHGPHAKPRSSSSNIVSVNLVTSHISEEQMFQDYLGLESYAVSSQKEKSEDQELLEWFQESIVNVGERYQVKLPWKEDAQLLLNNRPQAESRLHGLLTRLSRDHELKEMYTSAMDEFESLHFSERIPEGQVKSSHPTFYLPHHPVVRVSSKSTKCRPVFAANTKGRNGVSLNDCLHTGPSLTPEIPDVLLRLRMHSFLTTSDIRKAFLQVLLHPEDRDACRYLWIDSQGLQREMRFRVVTFGLSAAPFLLNATIRFHLRQRPSLELMQELDKNFYVDNLSLGASTVEEAFEKATESFDVMKQAGMVLAQWSSNSPDLKQRLQEAGFEVEEDPEVKLLGLRWCTITDTLFVPQVHLEESLSPPTKRQVLGILARIFDPLGFVAPISVRGKILMQRLWSSKLDWDEPIEDPSLQKEFTEFKEDVSKLSEFRVPRNCLLHSLVPEEVSLHVFCDASPLACVATVYIRQVRGSFAHSSLLVCKTKVSPAKVPKSQEKISLPRLELIACWMGAKLLHRVSSALHLDQCSRSLWSDSLVALWWIKTPQPNAPIFVRNRVRDVLSLTDASQWNYVPSKENPADIPSRGEIGISRIRSSGLWLNGPTWLSEDPSHWPDKSEIFSSNVAPSQEILVASTVVIPEPAHKKAQEESFPLERFGSIHRLVRTIAWIIRFAQNCRLKTSRNLRPLSTEELEEAELRAIRNEQKDHFPSEFESLSSGRPLPNRSPLSRLNPVWDSTSQMLVSVGRERPQAPLILLPKSSHLSVLFMRRAHEQTLHSGPDQTLAKTREKFWIVHGRRVAKGVVHDCLICRRFSAPSYAQVEAALPLSRTSQARPFSIIGVDFAGPLYVKGQHKSYVALFTCAVIRAVHLELVEDLTTQTFLLAFRRFEARRGEVQAVYSDNALTFRKAARLLPRVHWMFIPDRSPWWGGFYERLVRSIKNPLRKTLGRSLASFRELETVLVEVEGVLNSRPLTLVSDLRDDEEPLTPNHFIRPSSLTPQDSQNSKSDAPLLAKMWRNHQRLLTHWWKRWHSEYLTSLHQWHSHQKKGILPSKGDVILVEVEGQPRVKWPLGRVHDVITGTDGVPRAAFVKVGDSIIRRPSKRLFPLEVVRRPLLSKPPLRTDSSLAQKVKPELSSLKCSALSKGPSSDRENSDDRVIVRTSSRGRQIKIPSRLQEYVLH